MFWFSFFYHQQYIYISISNDFKRTDYPGKEIANLFKGNGIKILEMKSIL